MHRGYIKIWRKVRDSFIWEDSEILKLFLHLIMEANYQETEFLFNGKKEILRRGDLMCGRHKLSAELGISENKIYRVLAILEKEQLIEQRKTNAFTVVSIVKYNDYQSNEQRNEQPVDNQQTTDRQPVDTSKELIRTKKNQEEVKHPFLLDTAFKAIFEDFLDMRRKVKKPPTHRAQQLILKDLEKYPIETAKLMIEESIKRNWMGVFELKQTTKTTESNWGPEGEMK